MKLEKLLVVAVALAASTLVGCRYNKAGADGADGANGANGEDSAGGADVATVTQENDDGTTSVATERPFSEYCEPVEGLDLAPVYFGFDSTALPNSEIEKIEVVAKDMQDNPKHVVVIEGNCDERGSNEYNMGLGENRAIGVRDYLVKLGIAENRIQTKSYGEEKPALQGSGEDVWAKNRRGEFAMYMMK